MKENCIKHYFTLSKISYYMAVVLIFMSFNMVFFFLAHINDPQESVHRLLVMLIADGVEVGLFIAFISLFAKPITVSLKSGEPDAIIAVLEKNKFVCYRVGDDIMAYKGIRNAYFGGAFFLLKKQDGYEIHVARGCKNRVVSLLKR